jgi:hypothetical protein
MSRLTDPLKNPIARKPFSRNQTDPIHRPIHRSSQTLGRIDKDLESENGIPFSSLISNKSFQDLILKSNLFIFGKVGFFDFVIQALLSSFDYPTINSRKVIKTKADMQRHYKEAKTVRNAESEQLSVKDEIGSSSKNEFLSPVILLPTEENQINLNKMVAEALNKKNPVWLVALPSQIQPHLLLSFNCFFIAPGPKEEINILSDITPISSEDAKQMHSMGVAKAIFASDKLIPKIGLSNRLGTVIYINELHLT